MKKFNFSALASAIPIKNIKQCNFDGNQANSNYLLIEALNVYAEKICLRANKIHFSLKNAI
jgi:hypothetical protein